jgi:cation transport protein ChaC
MAKPRSNSVDHRKGEFPPAPSDVWIFAYGSLMWDPGFPFEEARPGTLHGYHRAFCVYSTRYRGTPDRPGLVLGLDRGGSCRGIVYRVAPGHVPQAMDYLWDREMVSLVYRCLELPVRIQGGAVTARAFVARQDHPQYTGKLSTERTAELICQAHGQRGACRDYLENTVRHLDGLGIADGPLHRLLALVRKRSEALPQPPAPDLLSSG